MNVGFAWQRYKVVLELGTYPHVHDAEKTLIQQKTSARSYVSKSILTLPEAAELELMLNLLQHRCRSCPSILPGK